MRAALLALFAMICAAAPALVVRAQDAADERPAGAIVLVVDRGHVRMSPERLGRAIARALARDVVRITDARARDAAGTLTIVHDAGTRWHVRFEARGRSASVATRIRPAALDAMLADASLRVLTEVESAPDPAAARATSARTRSSDAASAALSMVWPDEILDPFADGPAPPRRELAIFSEVIDPFAPAASRRGAFVEVLDPWGR